MRFTIKLLLFLFVSTSLFSQDQSELADLQAIKNRNYIFYNLGSYTITTQEYSSPFNDKKLKPILRKYKIKWKKNKPLKDPLIKAKHYKFLQVEEVDVYKNHYAVYAVENKGKTSVITFSRIGELNDQLMSSFIHQFIGEGFSNNIYAKAEIDSIKYLNRYIQLGPGCHWMGVRNVQCPYNGQMDWTIHSSMEEVKQFNKIREYLTVHQRKLKLISRDTVDITFEGKKTQATKLVLDVKGINSLLLNLQSGAKNLIAYYIAEEIDGKFVSCILSHWDNDRIQPNGLPALLGEVMTLENK